MASDAFESGIISSEGETVESTLSETPLDGEITVNWSRTVDCFDSGDFSASCSAQLELAVEKNKGSGWVEIDRVSYSASCSETGSGTVGCGDSDNGDDSLTHTDTDLEAGDKIRLRVTDVSGSGDDFTHSADGDDVSYSSIPDVDGDLDEQVDSLSSTGEGALSREADLDEQVESLGASGEGSTPKDGSLDREVSALGASGEGVISKEGDLSEEVDSLSATGAGGTNVSSGDLDETVDSPLAEGEGVFIPEVFGNLVEILPTIQASGEGEISRWDLPSKGKDIDFGACEEPEGSPWSKESADSSTWEK